MSFTDDYFALERVNDDPLPLVTWGEYRREFMLPRPLIRLDPVGVKISDPKPKQPVWGDYHGGSLRLVFSRLRDVLVRLDLPGLQLVPATLDDGAKKREAWVLHVWREIQALDRKQSDCDYSEDGDMVTEARRIVLSAPALQGTAVRERSIFVLAELTSLCLVHREVRDALQAVAPVGLRFIPLAQWDSQVDFRA